MIPLGYHKMVSMASNPMKEVLRATGDILYLPSQAVLNKNILPIKTD
jgi:hypothetical protein